MQQCSVCSSTNTEIVEFNSTIKEQFGPDISIQLKAIECKECGVKIDDVSNDTIKIAALKQSRIEAVKAILSFLLEKFTLTCIERILGIRPFGTLKKWQDDPTLVNDVEFALLLVLRVNPQIINKLDNQKVKQINKGIYFTTNNGQKIREIDLDETDLSVVTIDDTLVVIGEKSVRISVDEKKTTHKPNEVFVNR